MNVAPDTWAVRFRLDPFTESSNDPTHDCSEIEFNFADEQVATRFLEYFTSNEYISITGKDGKARMFYPRAPKICALKRYLRAEDIKETD